MRAARLRVAVRRCSSVMNAVVQWRCSARRMQFYFRTCIVAACMRDTDSSQLERARQEASILVGYKNAGLCKRSHFNAPILNPLLATLESFAIYRLALTHHFLLARVRAARLRAGWQR